MTDAATLLPSNATPLERAAAAAGAGMSAIPTPLRDVWRPYACPANILPWLAYAYAVDDWDESWDVDTQRRVIAQALPIKHIKATYGAVQNALTAMGLPARVREWYQQTPAGDPYTFRLALEVDQVGFNAQQLSRVRSTVTRYKNTRSHLDGIDISVRSVGGPRPASIAITGAHTDVSDGTPRYSDDVSALDFMVDGAVNGYAQTADAADQLGTILAQLPATLTLPTDL